MPNMINSFLNPDTAYRKAGNEVDQGWKEQQAYERPFWQQGQDQYGRLNNATGELMDPASLESKWSEGYEQSPYARQMLAQNQTSGMDAASSMGLGGSSAAIQNIQTGAGNIVQQDRQRYMDDLMQKYMAGIGLGSNIYGTGAQAGQHLGAGAQQHGENAAGLRYGEHAAPGAMLGKIIGTGLNIWKPGAGNAWGGSSQPSQQGSYTG